MLSKSLSLIGSLILLAWLTFAVSQAALSQRKINCRLNVIGSLTIDVCEDDNLKTFVLAVDLGQIYFADSLFGFNYEIHYDTGNVQLENVLYINTLSEGMELKAFTNNSKEGKINGYAMTASLMPIAGNKPLVAFAFKWKNTCSDSAVFRISYIEFTDEFKVLIDSLIPAKIFGNVFPSDNRKLLCSFENKIIQTKSENLTTSLNLKIPKKSMLDEFQIAIKSNGITIDSVYSVTGNLLPLSISKVDSGYKIHLKNLNDNGTISILGFDLRLDINKKDFRIMIMPEINIECKCISEINSDTMKIELIKDTTTNVEEIVGFNFENVEKVILINILGQAKEMKKEFLSDLMKSQNFIPDVKSGVYFIIIQTNDKVLRMKMINIVNNRSH